MNLLMSYNTNEGYGAIGRYVELVNNLLKYNDIRIYYISPEGYDRSEGNNFTHISYKKSNIKPNFIYAWFMITLSFIKNLSKIKKVDKCILFNGANSFIFALLKSFFKYEIIYSVRVNIVVNADIDSTLHQESFIKKNYKKTQFRFYSFLESYIVNKSEKIVFQSEVNAKEYKIMYGVKEEKIVILNNNCNPSWVGGEKKLKLNDGFNIGFVGNIFRAKGLKVIIDAFKIVKENHTDCNLTIIGDGPDRKYFESYVNHLATQNITFLGHIRGGYELMHNFDLLVVPSYMEAFPNVILEALYYKIPVFGSNVGGIPFILEKEFLFEAGDDKTLANKIIYLLDDENYVMALKNVEKTRDKFLFDWGYEFYKIIKK